MSNKQKIIIYALTLVLVLVSFGAFWDLYAREHICIGNCIKANTPLPSASQASSTTTTSTNGGKQQPKANIDTSLYSTCTASIVNKACKDCCDSLAQDTAVIQACKKSCNTIGQ